MPVDTPVEVTGEDGAFRVTRPATPTGIGIDLEDPANDPLPTDPADPRVVDSDGDGNPGVTATVQVTEDLTGEIYLARREIFAYDVSQESPDRLVGVITDSSEQLVIGASDDAFLTPAQWEQIDDPSRNPGDLGAGRRRLGLRAPRRGARRSVPAEPRDGLVAGRIEPDR